MRIDDSNSPSKLPPPVATEKFLEHLRQVDKRWRVPESFDWYETILASACWYVDELGLNIIPVHGPRFANGQAIGCTCGDPKCGSWGKHPRVKDWVNLASSDPIQVMQWFSRDLRGSSIGGVVGGEHGWPLVWDIDPRNGGDETYARLVEKYGPLPPTWESHTGGGGSHILVQPVSADIKLRNGKLGNGLPGIDFLSRNKQFLLPPSPHHTGGFYRWVRRPDEIELAAMPEPYLRLVTEGTNRSIVHMPSNGKSAAEMATISSGSEETKEGAGVEEGERNNKLATIAWTHRRAGASRDALVALLRIENQRICDPPLEDGEVDKIARQAAKKPTDDELGFQRDKNGAPMKNLHNIEVAIKNLGYTLTHDTFSNRLLCNGESLSDAAVAHMWLETEKRFRFRPGKDYYWTCVEEIAHNNPRHPVIEYLDALEWDGIPRLDHWLVRYLGAPDNDFTRAVSAVVLIAAVRRVRQPGVKFDEMLILEGEQGTAKSSALEILSVNEGWFSDDLPLHSDTKRQMESLGGRWLVEASELNGMRKGEVEHLKSFLSRRVDRSRLAWGRIVTELRRQCIIIGTTNSTRYLQDMTGNRRFWPVTTGEIDIEGLKTDRDQLWAEASAREGTGESVRLPARLWRMATEEQEDRALEDGFYDILKRSLDGKEGKVKTEWLWELLQVPPERRMMHSSRRLGEVMKKLGWQNASMRFGPGEPTARGYWRGNKDHVISIPVPANLK